MPSPQSLGLVSKTSVPLPGINTGIGPMKVALVSIRSQSDAVQLVLQYLARKQGDVSLIDLEFLFPFVDEIYVDPPTAEQMQGMYDDKNTVCAVLSCIKDHLNGRASGGRIAVRMHRRGSTANIVSRIEEDF